MVAKIKIDKSIFEKLIKEGLSQRDIAKKLNCSVKYVAKTLKLYNLKTIHSQKSRECKNCGKPLIGKQQYYCCTNCKVNFFYKKEQANKFTNNCHYQTERGKKKKLELIAYLGGKCFKCGYNKNYAALNFHHKDISSKVFSLDSRMISSKNIEALKKEADKCILLCANCHMEEHHPQCIYKLNSLV